MRNPSTDKPVKERIMCSLSATSSAKSSRIRARCTGVTRTLGPATLRPSSCAVCQSASLEAAEPMDQSTEVASMGGA